MSVKPSQLEKRFITTSMYKRSRHYLDITKLNQIEVKQEQWRRKPYLESTTQSLDSKFEESFISTQTKLNERLQTEFDKHQKRFFHDEYDDNQTNYSLEPRKGKTLDMSKMLPRNYFERESEQCKNQNHFCNFRQYQIPSNHKVDFNKFHIPKSGKRRQATLNCSRCRSKTKANSQYKAEELNADICGKIREKLIFDESLYKTMVDYKKYNKEVTEREEDEYVPQIDYDLILVGEEMTSKKAKGAVVQFYHGVSKWNSAQMENRLMKQNEFFLKVYNKKNEKQLDWSIIKRKTDLVDKRRREIMMRKNIKDIKGQICDQLYFRRNH